MATEPVCSGLIIMARRQTMKSKAAEGAKAPEGALSTWTIPSSLMAQGYHKDRRYMERHFHIELEEVDGTDVVDRSVKRFAGVSARHERCDCENVFVCSTGKRKEERNVVVRLTLKSER